MPKTREKYYVSAVALSPVFWLRLPDQDRKGSEARAKDTFFTHRGCWF